MYYEDEYLTHHGVKGQEWGERNGPPYPLNSEGKEALQAQKKRARAERKADKKLRKASRLQDYIAERSEYRHVYGTPAMVAEGVTLGGVVGTVLAGQSVVLGSGLAGGMLISPYVSVPVALTTGGMVAVDTIFGVSEKIAKMQVNKLLTTVKQSGVDIKEEERKVSKYKDGEYQYDYKTKRYTRAD